MVTIVYLDAEDEITSAASRIRAAGDTRVGLVLPFGSRVATSRINFRLLAREAQANGRRLDIVAPDASARALAASAGLSVFGSVGEYEAALDLDEHADRADLPSAGEGTAGAATGPAAIGGTSAGLASAGVASAVPIDPSRDIVPLARPRPSTGPGSSERGTPGTGEQHAAREPSVARGGVARGAGRGMPGRGALILVAVLALLVAGGAFAAVNLLPTATITVTPRIESVGPVEFSVVADPDATAVDPDARTIPATTISIPVEAAGEFPATGKRVEQTKATGSVRFTNCDPSSAYTIPGGTTVTTRGGIAFLTAEEAFLPVAGISGTPPNLQVECTTNQVGITAAAAGPDGNVGAGQIRVVPARYNRSLLTVTNPETTTGGTREEFPKVIQADIDAALVQLAADGQAQFEVELENPERLPVGTTVFPETAVMGALAPLVDPSTLVDQEVATFQLGIAGSGTVLAADASPVELIAEQRLQSSIKDGYELVEGSTSIVVGSGTVVDGIITFDVQGSAQQLRPLDAAALETLVLGLPEASAAEALALFGEVEITLWPDYVTSVPASEGRVTLTIAEALAPDPTPTPDPTVEPEPTDIESSPAEASPGGDASSEPVPSG